MDHERLLDPCARLELRKESVDLALAAASRLMQENLDQDKDRQLVERYLSELGAGGGVDA